ncbi:hypothetical protein Tco_0797341 [Tanacetum coccineum]
MLEKSMMTMQQVQVNTKFLNALPSEWSKFVTDVKIAKSFYTTDVFSCSVPDQMGFRGYELTILADKFLEMMTLASEDFNLLASLISWCLLETFLNENMLSRSSRIRRNILKMVMEIKQWHGYAVSSLMDTAYWSSE